MVHQKAGFFLILILWHSALSTGHRRRKLLDKIKIRPGPPPDDSAISILDVGFVKYHAVGRWPGTKAKHCCAANFTAAWDIDGDLLAIVIDNLLCEQELQRHRHTALYRSIWDDEDHTYWRFENDGKRQYHANGTGLSDDRYRGAFPGATGRPSQFQVKHNIQDMVTSCMGDLTVQLALAKSKRLRWLHRQTHYAHGQSPSRYVKIYPNYFGAFFASICLRPEHVLPLQSRPHTDSSSYGFASVLTLTPDARFSNSGTALTRNRETGISVVRDQADAEQFAQWHASTLKPYPAQGYLNGSGNIYVDIVAKVPNKYNRIALYLRNRLHAAYFEDASLLDCDPRKGRLTYNAFYDIFVPEKKTCQELSRHFATNSNPWTMRAICDNCVRRGCGFCFTRDTGSKASRCTAASSATQCEQDNGVWIDDATLATCKDASIGTLCWDHKDCQSCTENGCSWCADAQLCLPESRLECPLGNTGMVPASEGHRCRSDSRILALDAIGQDRIRREASKAQQRAGEEIEALKKEEESFD